MIGYGFGFNIPAPIRRRSLDGTAEVRELAGFFWHRPPSTGGAWVPVPVGALAALFGAHVEAVAS